MIKNISSYPVRIKWDGREKILAPGEVFDLIRLNVLHDMAALIEVKLAGKFPKELEVVKEITAEEKKEDNERINSVQTQTQSLGQTVLGDGLGLRPRRGRPRKNNIVV